ncbi:nuclear transport factor 2 family protein [Mesorhizobium sp. YR577]|jgi:hypothetical protein|uniref:nuclear transport factor 2 family protein n=1 Tax=Mesorhizobium sp. YR577 TaxID=1884373 RepID=UPI0008EE1FF4|nr:nuclear transport factor 2 family protein [Mesorhizobium sp. YR577]SFU21791.1 SnoaL-like domain-containing protein [Mesorhizobium sp. YR577]
MNALERLVIRDECMQLMTAYCTHLDARNEKQFLDIFTEDAIWTKLTEPTSETTGRAAIADLFRKRPPSILSRHLMLNHTITIHGADSADGVAVGVVIRGNRDRETWPMPLRGVELVLEYRLSFRREPDRWRINRCDTMRLLDVEAVSQ